MWCSGDPGLGVVAVSDVACDSAMMVIGVAHIGVVVVTKVEFFT